MTSMKPGRAAYVAAMAGVAGLVLMSSGCDKTESKSSSESKKVVATPEGTKTVTEKTETKTTTEPKK